jgi:mevalonate kinase
VRSALPVGAGLGSSASYSVCLATGFLLNFGHISLASGGQGAELINKYSFEAEKIFHGNPSGIDNAVATFGERFFFFLFFNCCQTSEANVY